MAQVRLLNLPWTVTRNELSRYLSKTLDTRVKASQILYDKKTGLSRGMGLVRFGDERVVRELIAKKNLEIEGRPVTVVYNHGRRDDE